MPSSAERSLNVHTLGSAGHGIRPAGEIPAFPDVDVAPTLAHLLHVRLDGVQGKPLTGILEPGD